MSDPGNEESRTSLMRKNDPFIEDVQKQSVF